MKLVEDVENLSKEIPFINPDLFGEEGDPREMPEMKKAIDALNDEKISESIPLERSGLYRLEKARDKLKEAFQQAQDSGKGGESSRPIPHAFGQGYAEPYQTGEEVRIPAAEDYQVPEDFRRAIMEAMKNPSPQGYERLNQQYYEWLVR